MVVLPSRLLYLVGVLPLLIPALAEMPAADGEMEEAGLLQVAPNQAHSLFTSPLDLRAKTPACSQVKPDFCWATVVSEVAAFYDPASYAVWDYAGRQIAHDTCQSVECYVAGLIKYPNDPHYCCPPNPDRRHCWQLLGMPDDIMTGIRAAVGEKYTMTRQNGHLTKESLDRLIALKKPLVLEIQWGSNCHWHYVTLAGGDGKGKYFLHDSMYFPPADNNPRVMGYQELTYEQVVTYSPPNNPWWNGQWKVTIYPDDPSFSPDLVEATMCGALLFEDSTGNETRVLGGGGTK